jgi:hypothetical protein
MDMIQLVNALKDLPIDKIIVIVILSGGFYISHEVVCNNTSAMVRLNTTLATIIQNQVRHEEKNHSDFKLIKTDLSNVRGDVHRVEKDVAGLADDIGNISARMATKEELQSVSQTVSIIQGSLTK